MKWKRITGEGYDLVGTKYAVRWSWGQNADGELVGWKREYAVIDLERDENLAWFDYCDEARRHAESLAREERRRELQA
jgi:hypothetical protein